MSIGENNGKPLFIGTSGWNYKNWKEDFYQGVPQKNWLAHYASRFNSVEVNATFYRQLKPETYEKWLAHTPQSFSFVLKGTRYVTHIKRLKDPGESILKQRENTSPLQPRLAALLWQLPANLEKDVNKLKGFAGALAENWPEARHVIEFRNSSWFSQEVAAILQEHGLGNCLSDAPHWPMWEKIISGLAYVRLHGDTELYRSEYTEEQLAGWASKARQWLSQGCAVFFFFDNTDSNHAPKNALRLREMLS